MKKYYERITKARQFIDKADYILIGAGAGLSSAGGLVYAGNRFRENFKDFIENYGIKDMYSGGFYPFNTSEEKWAYWSRYVYINRYNQPNDIYLQLISLIKDKKYFIITTNVDHQFRIAGVDKNKIFYTQGDFGLFQCSVPCHNKTYDNFKLIEKMVKEQKNCKIPTILIPKCPICGREMEMNLRSDDRFVQDEGWYRHAKIYNTFLERAIENNLLLIEIGIGFNTPAIIRFPFEDLVYKHKNINLIRINKHYPEYDKDFESQTVAFDEDLRVILNNLCI